MKDTMKFAVFPDGSEYHATKEISFTYHDSACGKVKVISLNSLCGAYIGSVTEEFNRADSDRAARTRIYEQPPAEFGLCKTCERLMTRRKGWWRVLAHYFRYWSGLRLASR